MIERKVDLPILALVAGTRVALGAGLGLLLSDRLTNESRRASGWALLAVGALTTIPLAMEVFGGREPSAPRVVAHKNGRSVHRTRRRAASA
jgi:hypothetical protein